MEGAWSYLYSRTALLLRIEMNILRVDKMRPLFQEAIVTKLAVTQRTTRYQLKAMDIIFQMIPNEYLWVKWFGHYSPAKLSIFPKKSERLKNAPFSQALKTCFWHTFFQTALIQRLTEIFSIKPTPNGHKYLKFSVKEGRANLYQSIAEIFKLKEWPHLIRKF